MIVLFESDRVPCAGCARVRRPVYLVPTARRWVVLCAPCQAERNQGVRQAVQGQRLDRWCAELVAPR